MERSAWSAARGAQGVERRAWSAGRGAQRVERRAWSAARGAQRAKRLKNYPELVIKFSSNDIPKYILRYRTLLRIANGDNFGDGQTKNTIKNLRLISGS